MKLLCIVSENYYVLIFFILLIPELFIISPTVTYISAQWLFNHKYTSYLSLDVWSIQSQWNYIMIIINIKGWFVHCRHWVRLCIMFRWINHGGCFFSVYIIFSVFVIILRVEYISKVVRHAKNYNKNCCSLIITRIRDEAIVTKIKKMNI